MLVSHRKQFIYTKTLKTAGTSVESYFEQYCMPEGQWTEAHAREVTVSDAGIVGFRGRGKATGVWWNHMPAADIRRLLGADVWDRYFKFCVVRNPFDKMISAFTMEEAESASRGLVGRLRVGWASGGDKIQRFRRWVKAGGQVVDRDKYLIDGVPCVDAFIQFEDLHDGVRRVCERLGVPHEPSRMPRFKMGGRLHDAPIAAYYDRETEARVAGLFAWEIGHFGYSLPR